MTNPTWFVLTIWTDKWTGSMEDLKTWLMAHHAKEGVIGLEVSPTSGKLHYQCKIHLSRGETLDGWKALIGPYGHVEVAQDKNFSGYEEKDGNFIKWPESPIAKFKNLGPLFFWEQVVLKELEKQDDRKILVVLDTTGKGGKTTFSKHLEANGEMDVCPVVSDEYNDYTGYCMEFPSKGYIFDIPRATSIKRRCAMWSGIEKIKDGLLYEKRYKPRKMWIDPPKVMIFTNEPDIPYDMLSRDRWIVVDIADYNNA